MKNAATKRSRSINKYRCFEFTGPRRKVIGKRRALPIEDWDMRTRTALRLINQTVSSWMADKAPRLGAALAYYAIFSIPPLVVIVIASTGFFYHGDVSQVILRQIGTLTGESTAKTIMEISKAQSTGEGAFAKFLGVGLLIFGASGVFG